MAHQKKPPTATRAEEEEVEEEVESSSSESEEDSKPDSSESEEDEEVTPVAPVKPVVVRANSTPKVRAQKQKQPDLAPATKKRPREESKAVSTKSNKRVAEDVVKKVGDSPKSNLFQRLFTEDDEIDILKALLVYSADKCIDPIEDFTDLHDFVNKYIHIDVNRSQLYDKIRGMKRKYLKKSTKTKQTFRKDHDKSCYDLSKNIWGTGCGGSELKKGKRIPKTPGLQIPQAQPVGENNSSSFFCFCLTELSKIRDVGMLGISDVILKRGFELLGDEARADLEHKWKIMVTAELDLNYKRLALSRELMKSVLGHRV